MSLFSLKAKPENATPEGECQVCMRRDLKATEDQRISLHGFTRPGDGHVYGRCPGAQYSPFEHAKDRAEWYIRDILIPEETRLEAYLQKLAEPGQPQVESISWQAWVKTERAPRAELRFFDVKNGEARVPNFLPHGVAKPSFAELVEEKLANIARDLGLLSDDIKMRNERNAAWTTRPLRSSNDPKAPTVTQQQRAHRQTERASARAAKLAKKAAAMAKRAAAAEKRPWFFAGKPGKHEPDEARVWETTHWPEQTPENTMSFEIAPGILVRVAVDHKGDFWDWDEYVDAGDLFASMGEVLFPTKEASADAT